MDFPVGCYSADWVTLGSWLDAWEQLVVSLDWWKGGELFKFLPEINAQKAGVFLDSPREEVILIIIV